MEEAGNSLSNDVSEFLEKEEMMSEKKGENIIRPVSNQDDVESFKNGTRDLDKLIDDLVAWVAIGENSVRMEELGVAEAPAISIFLTRVAHSVFGGGLSSVPDSVARLLMEIACRMYEMGIYRGYQNRDLFSG